MHHIGTSMYLWGFPSTTPTTPRTTQRTLDESRTKNRDKGNPSAISTPGKQNTHPHPTPRHTRNPDETSKQPSETKSTEPRQRPDRRADPGALAWVDPKPAGGHAGRHTTPTRARPPTERTTNHPTPIPAAPADQAPTLLF